MAKLTLQAMPCTMGMDTLRITGFEDGELSELKSMEHGESGRKLLDMLDVRNDGAGTMYMCGYGVYGHWFDDDSAYINVGRSCD